MECQCLAVAIDFAPGTDPARNVHARQAAIGAALWLSLYPAGQTLPNTITLNFDSTEAAIASGTFARVGAGGQVCVDLGMNATQSILR